MPFRKSLEILITALSIIIPFKIYRLLILSQVIHIFKFYTPHRKIFPIEKHETCLKTPVGFAILEVEKQEHTFTSLKD